MRLEHRHRAALTAAALGAALGVTPLHTAVADTGTNSPSLSLQTPDSIDVNGAAADIDITLKNPPAADSYLLFTLAGEGEDHLTVTDDTGARVPMTYLGSTRPLYTEFGKEDSDHDGIPGATLSAGTTHLHVTADGHIGGTFHVNAYLVDGATDDVLSQRGASAKAVINVEQPFLDATWTSPGGDPSRHPSIPVDTGRTEPVDIQLKTTMTMHTPPAATRTRWLFTAQEITEKGYTARQLAQALHVEYSSDGTAYTPRAWTVGADGSLYLDLPDHTWNGSGVTRVSESLRLTAAWGLPAGYLKGTLQALDGKDVQYSSIDKDLWFKTGSIPASARAAFYGRDRSGVLWQYQSSPTGDPSRYTSRTQVGGGWQAYDTVTKLSTLQADGTGDLVARDGNGVLWYYKATGNTTTPFAPRTKVGGGWQTYTVITGAGDLTGDGRPDLVARDRDGILWLYRATGNPAAPFAPRTKIGGGWQIYTDLTGGTDLTGDGRPDLLARNRDGVLWLYKATGNPASPFASRIKVGGGWNTYTRILTTGDTTGDGKADLIAIDRDGGLWHYRGTGNPADPFAARTKIGTGWNTYNTLI
ncbi:FG-GAP-like repeat-containing protein [Streptomyces sp. BPTC-684]|uniref:FG-GAP-like repeat-containing protein n=1 Tax=Streptomyces sp. BPTC-684 TaxID=3043734 RepID=UPI0024B13FA7|nr:FG-GAP-like repeat-containing protein [Streptomyces sp. BPTC-684]WHM38305.1 FG-GAP-like repeat-containing protein [Streptomyces sp. BPTC-684]